MHIILFHDGSTKEVNENESNIIMEKSCNKDLQGVKIGGSFYKFSAISKIMSQDDYYSEYPDKRPQEVRNQFEDLYGKGGSLQIRQPTEKAKELMKQGFMQYQSEQGRTQGEAQVKWKEFLKAGVDMKLNKARA